MYLERMTVGNYADIELTKAELDRIFEFAKYKWISTAKSTKEVINPYKEYSFNELYERFDEILAFHQKADLTENMLLDLIIQSSMLILSMRYEKQIKHSITSE